MMFARTLKSSRENIVRVPPKSRTHGTLDKDSISTPEDDEQLMIDTTGISLTHLKADSKNFEGVLANLHNLAFSNERYTCRGRC